MNSKSPTIGLIKGRKVTIININSKWFRSLVAFYVKIQKFKQAKFLDPIKYISELSEVELNIFHFYMLICLVYLHMDDHEYNICKLLK